MSHSNENLLSPQKLSIREGKKKEGKDERKERNKKRKEEEGRKGKKKKELLVKRSAVSFE